MAVGRSSREISRLRRTFAVAAASGVVAAAGCVSEGASPAASQSLPPCAHDSFGDFLDSHFSSDAWRDNVFRDYLTAPPVAVPAGLAAAALLARPFDESLQHGASGAFGGQEKVGEIGLGVLMTGSVLFGAFAPGEGRTTTDELWDQAEAFGLCLGSTELLKHGVSRHRPGDSGGGTSFPSGHAAMAFAAATLLDSNSGHAVGYPAYGVAAITAFSRVESGHHFPSDVLGGAALGSLTGGMIDALHFGTGRDGHGISGPRTTVGVIPEPGGMALGFVIDF